MILINYETFNKLTEIMLILNLKSTQDLFIINRCGFN